jgi:hypothetical protein
LLAAADLLERRADAARPSPWGVEPKTDHESGREAWNVCHVRDYPWLEVAYGMHEPNARYIATMHPEVGKALAAWLRSEAQAVRGGEGRGFDGVDLYRANPRSLALADLLLAGES